MSRDKVLAVITTMNNSTSLDCIDGVPSVVELYAAFERLHEFFLLVPIAFCVLTLTLYVINVREIIKHGQKDTKGNVVALFTIYPVSLNVKAQSKVVSFNRLKSPKIVACSSLVAIVVPRTYFFCDTIAHISFVIIAYQFYR